uniref:hypothetical protein n=1 Tax=Escherichia coli TaxID=562 RepID=UPI0013B3C24A
DYITHIGQEFIGGMPEFRQKLIKYSAKLGFRYVYTKNDARYIRAECEQKDEEDCGWYVKGTVSCVTGALVIKHGNLQHK